jgi:hypothetical protein
MKTQIGTVTPPRREAEAEGAGFGAGCTRSGSDTGPRDRAVALPPSIPGAFGFGRVRRALAAPALGLGLLILPLLALNQASANEKEAQELARFEQFAGEPVTEVRDFHLSHFEVLDHTSLAVWGRPGQVYLFDLSPPCTELQWARAIALRSTFNNLHVGQDYVVARGQRCYINAIRPIDEPAMRAARKAEFKR